MPSPDARVEPYLLLMAVLLLGLVGVSVIISLFQAWRRFNSRYRFRPPRDEPEDRPDPWEMSAHRIRPLDNHSDDDADDDEPPDDPDDPTDDAPGPPGRPDPAARAGGDAAKSA